MKPRLVEVANAALGYVQRNERPPEGLRELKVLGLIRRGQDIDDWGNPLSLRFAPASEAGSLTAVVCSKGPDAAAASDDICTSATAKVQPRDPPVPP